MNEPMSRMTADHEDQAHEPRKVSRFSEPLPPASQDEPAAILPDHINQNIEAVKALHTRADENLSGYQRPIETVSTLLARPAFFYGSILFIAVWVLSNLFAPLFGIASFDPAPYHWLQGILGLGAWLTATVVLITQTRQGKLAEQRAQLGLQVSLLAEQKAAKLIALIEELRRDLPNVTNRYDPQAVAMEQATDPHAVLGALEETLQEPGQKATGPKIRDPSGPTYACEESRESIKKSGR
jgi:uncharacterized membrane protein